MAGKQNPFAKGGAAPGGSKKATPPGTQNAATGKQGGQPKGGKIGNAGKPNPFAKGGKK